MLHINDISYHVGGRPIFDHASARVPAGHKVGLVGGNGSGKTTLLRLITGQLELDGGRIDVQKQCRVGAISQDAPGGSRSPLEAVLEADTERDALITESLTASTPARIAHIHERLHDIDAHGAPSRAAAILAGLGFDNDMQQRPLDSFSGGWKMRVALGQVLFCEPDLLLLDEPTNHLDLESVMWLTNYLRQYRHTLVLVSHDRDLLNGVADTILMIRHLGISSFSGNYDACEQAIAQQESQDSAIRSKQEADRARLQSFVDRFRAKATKASQAQSRLKMLERLAPLPRLHGDNNVHFKFHPPLSTPSVLLKLEDVNVGYNDTPVLTNVHHTIYKEDKIALLGGNGNGKSTLARLLCGRLSPMQGHVSTSSKLRVGYFAQNHLEQMNPDWTALQQVAAHMPDSGTKDIRSHLGRFGFGEDRVNVVVSSLSGGEKTRLALCLVALERPNLMLLDEPTNHLDMASRAALIEGLNEFEGAVVLISHDRRLIEATCDQLWLVEAGKCTQYFEDMTAYHRQLLSSRSGKTASRDEDANTGDRGNRKAQRRDAAQKRKQLAPLRKQAEQAETRLAQLQKEIDTVDNLLADPSVYEREPKRIKDLTASRKELEQALEQTETAWLEAQDTLDAMEKDAKG